ncbi:hypothetical protein Q6247_25635, partial [Klebsiella pneumoniae]
MFAQLAFLEQVAYLVILIYCNDLGLICRVNPKTNPKSAISISRPLKTQQNRTNPANGSSSLSP